VKRFVHVRDERCPGDLAIEIDDHDRNDQRLGFDFFTGRKQNITDAPGVQRVPSARYSSGLSPCRIGTRSDRLHGLDDCGVRLLRRLPSAPSFTLTPDFTRPFHVIHYAIAFTTYGCVTEMELKSSLAHRGPRAGCGAEAAARNRVRTMMVPAPNKRRSKIRLARSRLRR
jgi:hypothetical protein